MPLHNRLKQRAEQEEGSSSKSLESQYNRSRPYLRCVTDYIGKGDFGISIIKELKRGNPNVERLMFYREGYEDAMKTFLELIDPK